MDYFEAIEKGKQHSALFETFGFSDDRLEKSHIENLFEHDAPSRGFTIDKKGVEIKERLQKMLADEQSVCTMLQVKWTSMLENLSDKPTVPAIKAYYYMVDGWEEKLGDLPLLFEREVCNVCVEDCDCAGIKAEGDSCGKLKSEYNNVVYRYIGCKREIALLETMLANFDDNKIYKLTVREAVMLGW